MMLTNRGKRVYWKQGYSATPKKIKIVCFDRRYSPMGTSSRNTLLWGFFVWIVLMANKRMISRDLVKSRRLGKLFEQHGEIAEFCLNLYCLGIPHHDEKGLITADPYDWKLVIHPVASRPLSDYENALNFLEECKLLKKSPCGRVYKYYNHERIQTYRSDRDRHTQFPEIKDFK